MKNKIYESTNNVLENHDTVLTSEIFKETGTTPREIYNWMSKNISYDKTIKGWKLRDAAKLYKDKKGNCHDQSYFTTLQLHFLLFLHRSEDEVEGVVAVGQAILLPGPRTPAVFASQAHLVAVKRHRCVFAGFQFAGMALFFCHAVVQIFLRIVQCRGIPAN